MSPFALGSLPARAGIGLRPQHMIQVIETRPELPWVEVHSENFLCAGGPRHAQLAEVARHYPVSCHGVGLSLGGARGISQPHLERLKALFDWVKPAMISEHLAWCGEHDTYLNDLFPVPYTAASLEAFRRNIDQVQQTLGRRILVENPSSYILFRDSTFSEWDFLAELAERADCGLLLDVNNIFVSAHNHGFDAAAYVAHLPIDRIGEIHVAGHTLQQVGQRTLRIDDHGGPPIRPVWELLRAALDHIGPRPVLLEWDNAVPELAVLQAEATKAQALLDGATSVLAADDVPVAERVAVHA